MYDTAMRSKQVGTAHLLRLDRGEEIVSSLTAYLCGQNIRAGSFSGIGAVDRVALRYYRLATKDYASREFSGEFEIIALNGNVSLVDGASWPHIHIVLGDSEYRCFGGHLQSATVGVTCEIAISALDTELHRIHDVETGLKLWDLR